MQTKKLGRIVASFYRRFEDEAKTDQLAKNHVKRFG
jgi:hypothetical protein